MKRWIYLLAAAALLLAGCEKKTLETAPASLFQMEGAATADGVAPGDGPEKFQKAYQPYPVYVAWSNLDSSYMAMSIREIPYDEEITTMIFSLFLDGKAMTEETACEKYGVETAKLHTLLSSTAFLKDHEVLFRYLTFDWKDGRITEISSEEINYNETFEVPAGDQW